MLYRKDPPRMPDTGETPAERLTRTLPLAGTPAQAYVEKRGIPLPVAVSAGLRFDPDFGGRAAVVAALTPCTAATCAHCADKTRCSPSERRAA